MTYIRACIRSKFDQIKSRTTELAALERLKIIQKDILKSGERLQDYWSSCFQMAPNTKLKRQNQMKTLRILGY